MRNLLKQAQKYKGFVKIPFDKQNVSHFEESGNFEFDIYVESLGAQKQENDQTGLVLKFSSDDSGETGDYFVDQLSGANIAIGEWVTISIPVADIVEHSGNKYFAQTFNQLECFPSMGEYASRCSVQVEKYWL